MRSLLQHPLGSGPLSSVIHRAKEQLVTLKLHSVWSGIHATLETVNHPNHVGIFNKVGAFPIKTR